METYFSGGTVWFSHAYSLVEYIIWRLIIIAIEGIFMELA
jgi:hypothetical protein